MSKPIPSRKARVALAKVLEDELRAAGLTIDPAAKEGLMDGVICCLENARTKQDVAETLVRDVERELRARVDREPGPELRTPTKKR